MPATTTPTAPAQRPTAGARTPDAGPTAGSDAAAGSAQLVLLGGFALLVRGQPCPTARPGQRLLAFVALQRGRPVARALVAGHLWREHTTARAAANLRSALSRLPRPDGRALLAEHDGRLVLAAHVEVDLWAGGTADEGLRLDLLPGWYEDWAAADQEEHRQARLHALEARSAELSAAGEHPRALATALAAVRAEPLRESAHRRVVQAHLAEGNPTEALRHYEGYRRLLAAELGLAPSPAIRQLVRPLLGRPLEGC